MQNSTKIYSSPSYKPIIFTKKNFVNSSLVQELKNINNENNSEIPDFSNIKVSLNFIIGGKYQIEKDTNLIINSDDFGFNEENGDGYIKFTLSKSDTGNNKETSTTGLVYFEKKQGNEVECHLAIDDKRSLNKKSSLIDFFKNVFKKIFGDKTKVDLISTKKELIAQKIENFLTKKDMQGEIQKEKQNLIECTKKFEQKEKKIKSLEKTLCEEKLTFDNEESVFKTSIEELKKHNNELQRVINKYEALTNEEDNSRVKKKLNALQEEERRYAAPLNKLQNQILGEKIQADSNKELSKLSQRMNFLFEQFNNLKKSQEKTASSLVQSLIEKLSSNETQTLSDVEIQEKLDLASSICMEAIKEKCSYILNEIKNITNQLAELNNNQKPIDQTTNLLNLKANLNILSAQVKEHEDNTEKHIIPLLKEKIELNIKNATLLKELSSRVLDMGYFEEAVDGMPDFSESEFKFE